MSSLVPCPECSRHVRRSETSCPFCGAFVAEAMAAAPERALPTMRLSRAALYAFAAASVGTAACGSDTSSPAPVYGAPFLTGGVTGSGGAATTGNGGGMAVPLYGAPITTGGTTSSGGNVGAGGAQAVPAYGLPAYTGGTAGAADAGPDGAAQGGGFSALYGGPPQK